MSDWTDSLQQASFRGVDFAVLGGDGSHGRRLAVHEYPFKDKPWAEDLGRDTRQFRINGFLISNSAIYGGGDVIGQRERFIAAAETEGSGTLVHPTLGELTVSIPRGGFTYNERWDTGRYFEITLICIESGAREFPSNDDSTADATNDAATNTETAAESDYTTTVTGDADFFTGISDALSLGDAVVDTVVDTAAAWISTVLLYAADATSLFNLLVMLPGNYGRYFAGRTTGFASSSLQPATGATVDSLISEGIAERRTVATACNALLVAAAAIVPANTAAAARAVVASLLAATANPADAVRLLSALFEFYPVNPTNAGIIGQAQVIVQDATAALFRRSAVAALARASALYQPSSADDAAALAQALAALFEQEIDAAGDTGDDATYVALRALRAAVLLDLQTRGAALPSLVTITSATPVPALVLAQRLYQDASRADELVTEANPVHPAFMPVSFMALGG